MDETDFEKLDAIKNITELISGGATGVDKAAELWAASRNIEIKVFNPDWKQFGRAAGPIRNKQMAEYADAAVLFPGGKGTESMCQQATKAAIKVFDYR